MTETRAAISRFYIIRQNDHSWEWKVVAGPYMSRSHARAFVRIHDIRSNDPKLNETAQVVSRLWLEREYPLTAEGEVVLLGDIEKNAPKHYGAMGRAIHETAERWLEQKRAREKEDEGG